MTLSDRDNGVGYRFVGKRVAGLAFVGSACIFVRSGYLGLPQAPGPYAQPLERTGTGGRLHRQDFGRLYVSNRDRAYLPGNASVTSR